MVLVLLAASLAATVQLLEAPVAGAGGSYDVTNCLGGVWSYPMAGTQERWAFAPDEYATYWSVPIPSLGQQPDQANSAHFELRGTLPGARYMAVASYHAGAALDAIADDELAPNDPYRVEIVDAPPTLRPARENTLYGGYDAQGAALAYTKVVYRLYLPATSAPTPPRIYYVVRGRPKGLPRSRAGACRLFDAGEVSTGKTRPTALIEYRSRRAAQIEAAARTADPCWVPRTANGWFASSGSGPAYASPWATADCAPSESGTDSPYPNPDNMYLVNYLDATQPFYVMRFRLPAVPAQTRYLSICTYQLDNGAWLNECVNDEEIQVGPDGLATVVVSEREQRPAMLAPGNWLPLESDNPLILIRHLRPAASFTQSPHFYDPTSGHTLADHMGDYFPQSRYCSTVEQCGL